MSLADLPADRESGFAQAGRAGASRLCRSVALSYLHLAMEESAAEMPLREKT